MNWYQCYRNLTVQQHTSSLASIKAHLNLHVSEQLWFTQRFETSSNFKSSHANSPRGKREDGEGWRLEVEMWVEEEEGVEEEGEEG